MSNKALDKFTITARDIFITALISIGTIDMIEFFTGNDPNHKEEKYFRLSPEAIKAQYDMIGSGY